MCIYLMKHQPPQVAERFAQCRVGDVVMSAITYAELAFGVATAQDPKRERTHLHRLIQSIPALPFDHQAGDAYGPVRLATRERKQDHLDKLIAAHAISVGTTLVTNNVKDFERYPGLKLENWLEPAAGA